VKFEKLITLLSNTFLLSIMASAARALIKPSDTIRQTFMVLCGSILFGSCVGIAIQGTFLESYHNGIISISGFFSRELIETGQTIAKDPVAYWQRIRGIAPNHQTDDVSEKEGKK
jgi:hypothetical protein